MKNKQPKKRLNIEISQDLHNEIKARAAIRNMSMTEYVIAILADRTVQEKFYE